MPTMRAHNVRGTYHSADMVNVYHFTQGGVEALYSQ
ncbi:hypothetical protein BACT_1291 [Bifidobacterium actinocoloniiforme DSM 22766]|uniref:Uncharacterized protein n=1 Tax=Bifidobacterium actinocoloniiforme DSM 22766 TaxID=1437605 RepID=A0A086Z237_9BIFI|nr:hypothetical protein BACT_1291 [Bifidobacterium actinocoloniiforme DSM 22766]